ncbi:MAG TPA: hypothetical protein DCM57_02545 [Treponema sp.]|jgi:hypothetical protein|nr:hypothetical protein [Treponema sp.]HBB43766.1 hypothetical protein [Treponema sp.]
MEDSVFLLFLIAILLSPVAWTVSIVVRLIRRKDDWKEVHKLKLLLTASVIVLLIEAALVFSVALMIH